MKVGHRVKLVRPSLGAVVVAAALITLSHGGPAGASAHVATTCPWVTQVAPPAELASEVVAQMTTAQKIAAINLQNVGPVQNETTAIPSLCIPSLSLSDGPAGIVSGSAPVTVFPAPIAQAATFDPGVVTQLGAALGQELRAEGIAVSQTPELNVIIYSNWGRSFENFSDAPGLTTLMGKSLMQGLRSAGVAVEPKHFGVYVQESNRHNVNMSVSDRPLYEVYLRPFEAATRAGAAALMCAYGQTNGVTTCANSALLSSAAQNLGFSGFIRTDFQAVSTSQEVTALQSGVDLIKTYDPSAVTAAVASGALDPSVLNRAVSDVLTMMFANNLIQQPITATNNVPVDTASARQVALTTAEESMVLLKNSGNVLPLSTSLPVSVYGNASSTAWLQGVGSAQIMNTPTMVSDLTGLQNSPLGVGNVTSIQGAYSPPLLVNVPLTNLQPDPTLPGYTEASLQLPAGSTVDVTVRSSAEVGLFSANNTPLLEQFAGPGTTNEFTVPTAFSNVPQTYTLVWNSTGPTPVVGAAVLDSYLAQMTTLARSDAAAGRVSLVDVGTLSGEGQDLTTLNLPGYQNQLVEAVAAGNPRTVVVLHTGGPVLMPWLSSVAGVVEAWYSGEEGGDALGALLTGVTNFSGHLPVTFPPSDARAPMMSFATWPQEPVTVDLNALGGLAVGASWYAANGVTPLFPWGYGLSYTTFQLSGVSAALQSDGSVVVAVTVTNSGGVAGRVSPQVYLTPPSSTGEPANQVAGVTSVSLSPGQSQVVTITIPESAMEEWSPGWVIPPGSYGVRVALANDGSGLSASFLDGYQPPAPGLVSVTPSDGGATVSWIPATPPAGVAPASSFLVVDRATGMGCTANAPATSCVVSGLTDGQSYRFQVSGFNAAGQGPASLPSIVTTPLAVPGSPSSLGVVPEPGGVALSWVAGTSGGVAPTYVVTLSNGASCVTTLTSCVITGLSNTTAYSATVVAQTPGGSSAPLTGSFTPVIEPATPTNVVAKVAGARVLVSWNKVTAYPGASGYVVTAVPGSVTCVTKSTTCAVTGLTPGVRYHFVVTTTVTGVPGASAPSASSNVVLAQGDPWRPSMPTLTPRWPRLVISWRTGPSVPSVTRFVVRMRSGTQVCSTRATSCTVNSLRPGVRYSFTVSAINSVGTTTGQRSVVVRAEAAPGIANVDLRAERRGNQFTLRWRPAPGFPTPTYRVEVTPSRGSCVVRGTQCVVALTPSTKRVVVTWTASNRLGRATVTRSFLLAG